MKNKNTFIAILVAVVLLRCTSEKITPAPTNPSGSNPTPSSNTTASTTGSTPNNPNNSTTAPPASDNIGFQSSVRPLLVRYCNTRGCHNYDYNGTRNEIDVIIFRINLDPSDRRAMPLGGPKLSNEEIDMFRNWKEANFPQ